MSEQAERFEFSLENKPFVEMHLKKYPSDRRASAVLPLLDIAQRQCGGWLPRPAMEYVADLLEMAPIRVYEVVSFYEMFHDSPRGTHELRVCTTTPCWLRGSTEIVAACQDELGCKIGEMSEDGMFSFGEFECLGACVNAPVVWIDDDYYEDIDPDGVRTLIKSIRGGKRPEPGTMTKRQTSAPASGLTTLTGRGE